MRSPLVSIFLIIGVFLAGTSSAQVYQYDALNRLQAANYADGSSTRYEYDANSNITRIRYQSAAVALPPDGVIDEPADDVSIETGESVTFEGSGTDPDGAVPLAFSWDFDGGAPDSTDEDPGPVTFNTAGTYTVELTVTDATGLVDPTPDTVVVTVTDPATTPPPPPPPPPPAPGGGGAPAQDSGGGGSLLWLPVLLGLMLIIRSRRAIVLATLLLAGSVNAQNWIQMTSGTDANLNDVWMHSPTLAYAVGSGGTVLRYDGNVWAPVDTGVTANLNGVWGTDPNNIYIVGTMGTVLHYDGSTWTLIDIGADTTSLNDVWQEGPGTPVYVVGLRGVWEFNGTVWDRMIVDPPVGFGTLTPDVNITAVRGFGDVIVATANGQFGTDPSLLVFHEPARRRFESINMWRGNGLVVFDANNIITAGESPRRLLNGTAANNADWGVGGFGFNGVWGTSHENVWALTRVGSSAEIRYRTEVGVRNDRPASERQLLVNFRQLNGIHGSDANNVMAVGTLGSIYAYLEPEGLPTAAKVPFSASTEDGVNLYTGELVYETTDIALNTRMPMEFRRYYATRLWDQQTVGERLSENWTHNYEWRIDTGLGAGNDQVRVTDYRGREYLFQLEGSSYTLVSPMWADVGLAVINGWNVFFDRTSGVRYAFGGTLNRLSWIEDRNGNRHSLNYNSGYLVSITDGGSGVISLRYTANGKLERAYVEKSTTLETTFAYENGVLVSATSPSGVVTRYTYEDSRRLTGIEIGSGTADAVTERTYEYDDEERVSAVNRTNAGRFEYGYTTDQTTQVSPDSLITTFAFDEDGNLLSKTTPLGALTTYTYDASSRLESVTDPIGRTTTFAYDEPSSRLASITLAGLQTRFSYSVDPLDDGTDFYDLDVVTLPNDATIDYGFDGRGNNDLVIDEVGNTWLFEYDEKGDLRSIENPVGGITTLNYFFDGVVRSILEPNGTETLFSYDDFLRLEIVTFGAGSANYNYSTRAAPDEIIDRSGARYNYSFNNAGYVSRIDRSDGYFEVYGYDGAGRLVSVNLADNAFWTLGYDSHGRLSSMTDPNLREARYEYDSDGYLSAYIDFDGRRRSFRFSADGQLAQFVRPGGEQTDFEYADPRGLLSAVVDGLERFGYSYDSLGLLDSAIDPFERVNSYERDARGTLSLLTNAPSNRQRQFGSDAFGNFSQYIDPLGGTRSLDYGDDNLLDLVTDPVGEEMRIGRDRENRVETLDFSDGFNVSVEYAGSGLPRRIQGSDGTDVEIDSSPERQILGGTDMQIARTLTGKVGDNNGIGILYNNDDRVRRITFSDGRFVDYEYNGSGDVVLVRDWLGGETVIEPTDTGKIDRVTYANGIVTDYDYDRATRIKRIDMGALGAIVVERGTFGRIESVSNTLPITRDMPVADRNFGYNLASQIDAGSYDSRGNQLQQGNNSRTWDALNRLTRTESGADQVVVSHDALGGVTRIASAGGDRLYVQNYALKNPRISVERDGAGNDLWYYVHTFNGRLLYRISPTGTRQFYHFDENGNTVLITSDDGSVLQSYFVAPHGEMLSAAGSVENPKVTYAEEGGINLGESGTVKVGSSYIDTRSGHDLKGKPGFDSRKAAATAFDGIFGRSVKPGYPIKDALGDSADGSHRSLQASSDSNLLTQPLGAFASFNAALRLLEELAGGDAIPPTQRSGSVDEGGLRGTPERSGSTLDAAPRSPFIRDTSGKMLDAIPLVDPRGYLQARYGNTFDANFVSRDALGQKESIPGLRTLGVIEVFKITPPEFRLPPKQPVVDSILKEVPKSLIIL